MMIRSTWFGFFLCAAMAAAGCDADRMSERGFSLPAGNAMLGKEAFVYLHCHECHTISGESLPALASMSPPFVELGGKVTQVKSYGELVTSIINPSHKLARGYPPDVIARDGQSRMPVYNSYMTVQELIDIVAYLQPKYDVFVPMYDYRVYP